MINSQAQTSQAKAHSLTYENLQHADNAHTTQNTDWIKVGKYYFSLYLPMNSAQVNKPDTEETDVGIKS
jgi:hypothetical protein